MAKTYLFSLLLAVFFSTQSIATPIDDIVAQIAKGEKALCSKGTLSKFKLAIRSFKGAQCKNRLIASLAEMICPLKNIDNYDNSKCHGYATIALNGQSPTTVFLEEIKSNASKYGPVFCPYMASVCSAINTAKSYIPNI